MIAILNLGPAPGNKRRGCRTQAIDPLGPHVYQIKINHQPVTTFIHTRSETLHTCLIKAAAAAINHHTQQLTELTRSI